MAYTTATLTGTYKTFDDQPATGVVEIIPNSRQLVDAEGDVILAGRVKVTLDEAGSFSVTLPATDDATVEPATGRQYTVVAKLRHTHLPAVTGVELATGATVAVADVASAPETDALVTPAATTAQLDALEADVTAALAGKQDAGDYATSADLTTGLATKADTAAVPAAPEDIGAEPAGLSATTEATLAATYARGVNLPAPNGTDDTAAMQAVLDANAGQFIKGVPGADYLISAPLVIDSDTTLDMSGCTVSLIAGSECNMLRNRNARTAQRTTADGASTSGSKTVTSATAAFTSADVGRTVVLVDAGGNGTGPLVGNIVTVTNATTVVLDTAATATVSAKSLSVFNRDTGIKVKGGTWNRGNDSATLALDRHSLIFRHVDGIDIDIDRYTATNGKFCIALGDVTNYRVVLRDIDSTSDGVHIDGPAYSGEIPYVAGHTDDDLVAFTCSEYPGYNDVSGDIRGCKVGGVYPAGSKQALKFLAGAGFTIDAVTADMVRGTTTQHGVWIGDDTAYASTTGGNYGSIEVKHLDAQPTGGAGFNLLYLGTPAAERIKAKVRATNSLTNEAVRLAGTSTATIKELVLEDCEFTGTALTTAVKNDAANGTIERLSVVRPRVGGTCPVLTTTAGTVKDFNVTEANIDTTTGTSSGAFLNGGTVESATFTDCKVTMPGTSWFVRKNNGTLTRLNIIRGRYTAATGALIYRALNAGAITLRLDGCEVTTFSRVAQFFDAATIILNGPTFGSLASPAFHAAGGAVTVTGRAAGTFTLISRGGTEALNLRGFELKADASILAKTRGDHCYNTNAALSCGEGLVTTDGTNWKNVYSGATY